MKTEWTNERTLLARIAADGETIEKRQLNRSVFQRCSVGTTTFTLEHEHVIAGIVKLNTNRCGTLMNWRQKCAFVKLKRKNHNFHAAGPPYVIDICIHICVDKLLYKKNSLATPVVCHVKF